MRNPDPITAAIAARLEALQAAQQLSAWSMIVTFMGDAIGPRGGVVSAAALQGLMQHLGIGAGAVRTAVSRLSAEGWIERSREGRKQFLSALRRRWRNRARRRTPHLRGFLAAAGR
jgi:phenylacetic acid degradation operon negative regulatory protein